MNTTVLGRTGSKVLSASEGKVSMMERFKNYLLENSAEIVSGMMALNGNTNALRTYLMLKKDTVK